MVESPAYLVRVQGPSHLSVVAEWWGHHYGGLTAYYTLALLRRTAGLLDATSPRGVLNVLFFPLSTLYFYEVMPS